MLFAHCSCVWKWIITLIFFAKYHGSCMRFFFVLYYREYLLGVITHRDDDHKVYRRVIQSDCDAMIIVSMFAQRDWWYHHVGGSWLTKTMKTYIRISAFCVCASLVVFTCFFFNCLLMVNLRAWRFSPYLRDGRINKCLMWQSYTFQPMIKNSNNSRGILCQSHCTWLCKCKKKTLQQSYNNLNSRTNIQMSCKVRCGGNKHAFFHFDTINAADIHTQSAPQLPTIPQSHNRITKVKVHCPKATQVPDDFFSQRTKGSSHLPTPPPTKHIMIPHVAWLPRICILDCLPPRCWRFANKSNFVPHADTDCAQNFWNI